MNVNKAIMELVFASVFLHGIINLPGLTCGQDIVARVEASKTTVQIAEPFRVSVIATAPAGLTPGFPRTMERIGDFDVVAVRDLFDIPDEATPGRRVWTREFTLETILTGELQIPAFEITASSEVGEQRQSVATKALTIDVVSVLEARADPMSFRDIQSVVDIEPVEPVSQAWVGWVIGGVLVFAGLAVGIVALKRRKRWISPASWASRELASLRSSAAIRETRGDAVFGKLELIIRTVIAKEFDLPATAASGKQLVELVADCLPASTCEKLDGFLNQSQQVRYAGRKLSEEQLNLSVDEGETLVRLIVQSGANDSHARRNS